MEPILKREELRVLLTPLLTIGELKKLLDTFGTVEDILKAKNEDLKLYIGEKRTNDLKGISINDVDRTIKWTQEQGIALVPFSSPLYPRNLLPFNDAPALIYVRGDPKILQEDFIGIVGTRRASHYGLKEAKRFSKTIAQNGIPVISGGARGIDREAHLGAIEAASKTVAVLGTGLDLTYPPEHKKLFERIAEKGVLVSEFPPGFPPHRGNFPRRNRLIAALSMGILIIESPLRSGSLITAKWALNYGREVFVIPGRLNDPNFEGNHFLIRNGARLVTSPEELLFDLGIEPRKLEGNTPPEELIDGEEELVISLINDEPIHLEEIFKGTDLSHERILTILTFLEMKGLVKSLPGGFFIRN